MDPVPAGLVRVLSSSTRCAMEAELRSLVECLGEPEALEVEVRGETATVMVPGGHHVKPRREGGVLRVDELDRVAGGARTGQGGLERLILSNEVQALLGIGPVVVASLTAPARARPRHERRHAYDHVGVAPEQRST